MINVFDDFWRVHKSFRQQVIDKRFRNNALCFVGEPRCYKSTLSRLLCSSLVNYESINIAPDNRFIFSAMAKEVSEQPRCYLLDDVTPEQWGHIDKSFRTAFDGNTFVVEAKNKDQSTAVIPPFVITTNSHPEHHTNNIVTRMDVHTMVNPFNVTVTLMDHIQEDTYIQIAATISAIRGELLNHSSANVSNVFCPSGMKGLVRVASEFLSVKWFGQEFKDGEHLVSLMTL